MKHKTKQIIHNVYDMPTYLLSRNTRPKKGLGAFFGGSQIINETYSVFTLVDANKDDSPFKLLDVDKRQYVARLGSQDLMRCGKYFEDNGYNIVDLELETDEEEFVMSHEERIIAVRALKEKKRSEIHDFFETLLNKKYAFARKITLLDSQGNSLSISRGGYVDTENSDYVKFLEIFPRAWYELGLS